MLSDVPLGCKVKEKEIKRATQLKSTITCCEQLMQLDQTSLEGELYPVYKDMREVNHFLTTKTTYRECKLKTSPFQVIILPLTKTLIDSCLLVAGVSFVMCLQSHEVSDVLSCTMYTIKTFISWSNVSLSPLAMHKLKTTPRRLAGISVFLLT